jgi:hypothetical protein
MSFRIVIELWHILYMVNIDSSYENNCLFSPGFDAVYEIWKVVCASSKFNKRSIYFSSV